MRLLEKLTYTLGLLSSNASSTKIFAKLEVEVEVEASRRSWKLNNFNSTCYTCWLTIVVKDTDPVIIYLSTDLISIDPLIKPATHL